MQIPAKRHYLCAETPLLGAIDTVILVTVLCWFWPLTLLAFLGDQRIRETVFSARKLRGHVSRELFP